MPYWTAGTLALSLLAAIALATPASAGTPTLLSVAHDRYHPTATFAAPGADSVTLYIASSPERATDGTFLTENVEATEYLTDFEIASGRWMDADTIASGQYHAMLSASTYDCDGPECTDGYSNILAFTVPARTLALASARSEIHDVMSDGRFARAWASVAYSAYDPSPIRRCSRLSRLRVRCNLAWFAGDTGYTGKATVIRRTGEEDDHVRWTVKVTDYYCRATSGKRCSRTYRGD
jgi:hypothetical protein